ncbi:RNA-directed DNA polymerase, eukaryota, reverse transcriptase zinc-binding domain protein, partial [Tanacetum coccineum]
LFHILYYGGLLKEELARLVEEKMLHTDSGGQETIWNKLVPKKVNIFVWRALKERLLVRVELDRRDIDLDSCGLLQVLLCLAFVPVIGFLSEGFFMSAGCGVIWFFAVVWPLYSVESLGLFGFGMSALSGTACGSGWFVYGLRFLVQDRASEMAVNCGFS